MDGKKSIPPFKRIREKQKTVNLSMSNKVEAGQHNTQGQFAVTINYLKLHLEARFLYDDSV